MSGFEVRRLTDDEQAALYRELDRCRPLWQEVFLTLSSSGWSLDEAVRFLQGFESLEAAAESCAALNSGAFT